MVRASFFDQNGIKRGAWSSEEDERLTAYIQRYGHWNWHRLPNFAGLSRSGKSCRLRWMNHLRPNLKHGNFSKKEQDLIAKLHNELGNKWARIAAKRPGRSDNAIKNYCNTHLKTDKDKTVKPKKSKLFILPSSSPSTSTVPDDGNHESIRMQSPTFMEEVKRDGQDKSKLDEAEAAQSVVVAADSTIVPQPVVVEETSSCKGSVRAQFMATNSVRGDGLTSFPPFDNSEEDFWTAPFISDDIYNQNDQLLSLQKGYTSPYAWSYHNSLDLFYQVMQDFSLNN